MANRNPFYVAPPDFLGETLRAAQTANYLGEVRSRNAIRDAFKGADLSTQPGRQAAASKAMAADPLGAQPYIEMIDRMDERDRERVDRLTKDVARVMIQIRNMPAEKQPAAYAEAQDMYREALPEPFSPGIIDRHIEDALSVTDILARYDKRENREFEAMTKSPVGYISGDQLIQKQYDPKTKSMVVVGGGPRFAPHRPGADAGAWETVDLPGVGKVQRNRRTGKIEGLPGQGGGVTQTQQAKNTEIDAARQYLTTSGFSMDEILRRTQETTSTGRENHDFDPYLAQTYRLAMSRKVGDDPDFASFQSRYRGGGTRAGAALALPRTATGDIDVRQLNTTETYDDGTGGRWKWTGSDFVSVP